MSATSPPDDDALLDAISAVVPPLLSAMDVMDRAGRYLDPQHIDALAAAVAPHVEPVTAAGKVFADVVWPEPLQGMADCIASACAATERALGVLVAAPADPNPTFQGYRALRHATRATEALYPLAAVLPGVSRYYLPAPARDDAALLQRLAAADPANPRSGVLHAHNNADQRGGWSLYVPETLAPEQTDQRAPLVVALHGGSGHGRAFLWTWLRAARAAGAMVLSPTSQGDTWSLMDEDVDGPHLQRVVAEVMERWPVDTGRVLLTGMSDGGTFTWLAGLQEGTPWTHLAPVSASFHPMLLEVAERQRLQGLPVYLVHGALDWMFPVDMARTAASALQAAGADVTYRELDDLSHTYPQEENVAILEWLMR